MRSSFARAEDGAALLEATLVLPILLLLVFGLTDVALYYWTANLANKAAQLGLRQALVSGPVAIGPGLETTESSTYWYGLPPGQRCRPDAGGVSPCPVFRVVCDLAGGCRCRGDGCGFRFSAARLDPIVTAMRATLPDLRPENVRVSYATNGLGYVQRPPPIPVDVQVSLLGVRYRPLFVLGRTFALEASAGGPSESLGASR